MTNDSSLKASHYNDNDVSNIRVTTIFKGSICQHCTCLRGRRELLSIIYVSLFIYILSSLSFFIAAPGKYHRPVGVSKGKTAGALTYGQHRGYHHPS